MSYTNIYTSPEKFGLEIFAQVDGEEGRSYDFNMVVVWKNKDGSLHWQNDAGCSCPSPFEDDNITTLKPLTKATFAEFSDCLEHYKWGESMGPDEVELEAKVWSYLLKYEK